MKLTILANIWVIVPILIHLVGLVASRGFELYLRIPIFAIDLRTRPKVIRLQVDYIDKIICILY